ncbi:hypothetical protein DL96DRAFT_107990 [Flagelloscypha sp. PMI_526]|nr:hypothetical protein DL96DRAFT_107990 [Flagelloscypha sp. PMI_526]
MQRARSAQAAVGGSTPAHTVAGPSIRLINATPSASGSTEPNTSLTRPTTTPSVPLGGWDGPAFSSRPLSDDSKKSKRLVPKKSKLFATTTDQISRKKSRDLSDVVRRVGGGSSSTLNLLNVPDHGRENSLSLARRGFEIYVDTQQDEEDMEVVVVKKIKSRGGLRGLFGDEGSGRSPLGDATNTANAPKEKDNKWWTMGKGKRDSKEKDKEKRSKNPDTVKMGSTRRLFALSGPKTADLPPRSQTPDIASYLNSAPHSAGLPPRSLTPEPFSTIFPQEPAARNRAASFDVLRNYEDDPKLRAFYPPTSLQKKSTPSALETPTFAPNPDPSPVNEVGPTPANTMRHYPSEVPDVDHNPFEEAFGGKTFVRSTSPFPPRSSSLAASASRSGSPAPTIALRSGSPAPTVALRSGSPAPTIALRSTTPTPTMGGFLAPPTGDMPEPKEPGGSIAFRAIRSMKSLAGIGGSTDADDQKKEKKSKSKKDKGSMRNGGPKSSTSSFEVGAASPLKPKSKGVEKKKSILALGLGIPGSLRMKGSSNTPASVVADENAARKSSDVYKADRLSVDSAYLLQPRSASRPQSSSRRSSITSQSSYSSHSHDEHQPRPISVSSGVSSLRPNSVSSSARSSYAAPANSMTAQRRASNASSSGGAGYSYYDGPTPTAINRDSLDVPVKRDSLDVYSDGRPANQRRVSSSSGSVRWDEAKLESAKNRVAEGRRASAQSQESSDGASSLPYDIGAGSQRRAESVNRHSKDGRRRGGIVGLFPGMGDSAEEGEVGSGGEVDFEGYPMLMLESATSDGHSSIGTPERKRRSRPISDEMIGQTVGKRQGGVFDAGKTSSITNPNAEGVLLKLGAATTELEDLIGSLEATPGNTPSSIRTGTMRYDMDSPMKTLRVEDSLASLRRSTRQEGTLRAVPRKDSIPAIMPKPSLERTLGPKKGSEISIHSLRPYAQSRKNTLSSSGSSGSESEKLKLQLKSPPLPTPIFAQPIAQLSSSPPPMPKSRPAGPVFRPPIGHRRGQLSLDGTPEPKGNSPAPIHPLKPAMSKQQLGRRLVPKQSTSPSRKSDVRSSMATFGHAGSSREGSATSLEEATTAIAVKRVFTRPVEVKGSTAPLQIKKISSTPVPVDSIPLPREAKRVLGMGGTMGGSDSSAHKTELDDSDPDSDIPDELQVILSGGETETFTPVQRNLPPSPGLPPGEPLPRPSTPGAESSQPLLAPPRFKAHVINSNGIPSSPSSSSSDGDNTKKSFDFTGELQKLNESGGGDRKSFVEQLENAFKTPAKVDLRYNFGDEVLSVGVPPVPVLPAEFSSSSFNSSRESEAEPAVPSQSSIEQPESLSKIVDVDEPSLLPGSDSLATSEGDSSHNPVPDHKRTRSTSSGRPSDGELDLAFKFGRGPKKMPPVPVAAPPQLLPAAHIRTSSTASFPGDGSSVLDSIYGQAAEFADGVRPRPRANSDVSIHSRRLSQDMSGYSRPRTNSSGATTNTKSRPNSMMSFQGFDSFDEVRRGFEFTDDRPLFYPPPVASNNTRRGRHARDASMFSIASVSSYGHVVRPGVIDPFDYALPSLRESSEDMTTMSYSVDDTFSFRDHASYRRQRVDSGSSSYYFRPPARAGHRRQESNMSVISQGPPISRYNRSHRQNDSIASASSSSIAHSYALHGANAGRAAWARHRPQEPSVDSISSEISFSRLGRPGIGDKMFDTAVPLSSIAQSPMESMFVNQQDSFLSNSMNQPSFDSLLDSRVEDSILDPPRISSQEEDSLFEKTKIRNSASSDAFFAYDGPDGSRPHLLPPVQFRPVSTMSVSEYSQDNSPIREDDTMISMLGGGHVRRRSIGSVIDQSPCVRMEKRKHSALQESPAHHPQIVEKPSLASASSFQFGGERMIRAQQGLLQRQSLEESALMAEGEDLSGYISPVFNRPISTRSRSSTCTSSSECPTPPLSASDGSMSEASPQSSLDLSHVNFSLVNMSHPAPSRPRARARPQGSGHRRRFSQARASRSSVYETIQEELPGPTPSKAFNSKTPSPTIQQPVLIADPNRSSIHSTDSNHGSLWDDEQGIMALRRYYALRDEAQDIVTESRKVWIDTPKSLFDLQAFQPPRQPQAMQALLKESVANYHPLPHELNPRLMRPRSNSRPSPYPRRARHMKPSVSPENSSNSSFGSIALKENSINLWASPAPALDALKPFSPLVIGGQNPSSPFAPAPKDVRPRVGSAARRSALGWSKRSTKSSNGGKENSGTYGAVMTPGASLRLNRPTPASRRRPSNRIPAIRA